jgi:molybdopterin converting factor small subunit
MAIVRLRAPLKNVVGGHAEQTIDGRTVGELLHELERRHPAAAGWILDERGQIRRHINVFVNGERGGADTPVGSEDLIDVLPAISGG